MKTNSLNGGVARTTSMRAVAAVSIAALAACAGGANAQVEYDFHLINSFNANPLAGEAFVADINNSGVVCGYATMDNRIGYPGYIWTLANDKVEVPVATPAAISNTGIVVGIGNVYNSVTGQSWTPPSLPGTYGPPSFGGVNDAGLAAGSISQTSGSDSGGVVRSPYVWQAEAGASLYAIPGAKGFSRVNNSNVALGWLNGYVGADYFIYDMNSGATTALSDVVPVGTGITRGTDINELGEVTGSRVATNGNRYGFVYSPTNGTIVLPMPGAGYQSAVTPSGINDAGVVVGGLFTTLASERPFVFTQASGLRDLTLNGLVAGQPTGYRMRSAVRVNNAGWIIGNGSTAAGKNTGWVLVPRGAQCDAIDFNADGLFPDTQDIDDFLSVFSGGPCSTGACGDIDFNNDGLFPDTADIDAMLRVFSGGQCI